MSTSVRSVRGTMWGSVRLWIVVAAAALAGCRGGNELGEPEAIRKVSPATVSIPGAWSLFDRSISSGFVPGGEPVRVELDHVEQISAIKAFGSAGYRLRITGQDGSSLGLPAIDLSKLGAGWHTVASSSLVSTNLVELRFESIGDSTGKLPELELWAVDDRIDGASAVDLTAGSDDLPPGTVALSGAMKSADVLPSDCATFQIPLARAPATFSRVHLVFTAEGLFRSFSLARTINGIAGHGGEWLAGDPRTRTFVDELDPSSLQLGTNEVSLCLPGDATRGVAITNLHLVAELDQGTGLVTGAIVGAQQLDAGALVDHRPDTALDIAGGDRVVVDLERLVAPDALVLGGRSIDAPARVECIDASTASTDLKVIAHALPSGQLLELDGGRVACRSLAVTFGAHVNLSGIDVIGSGAAESTDWPRIVVTSPPEHFGDVAWVGGYVATPPAMGGAVRVEIAGNPAEAMTGEFGRLLTRTSDVAAAWPVSVAARFPGGTTQAKQLLLDRDLRAQRAVPATDVAQNATLTVPTSESKFGREGQSIVATTKKLEATKVRLGTHVGVDIPVGALAKPTPITVKHLGETELPPLDPGMINVSAPKGRGYEFLPHGQRFAKKVEVVLPYDTALIPEDMKPEDVHTYYFDPKAERWQKLERVAVDVGDRVIRSSTDHYTIMIDAVLTVPKNPSPLSIDPTALASIAAASPAANIDLMEPPSASSSGDARMSLPIRLPAARGNYSPSLAIAYASSGGNSWLGVGWDLSSSQVEIDTRFGVPTYSIIDEPRYLLDGAALVPTLENEGPRCSNGRAGRRYHARVEGGFAHILRCDHSSGGIAPASRYGWEVRDRDGTLFVYGVESQDDPNTDPQHTVLADPTAPHSIFRWYLRRVVDVHGNTSEFSYQVDDDGGAEPGREVYPSEITYTAGPGKAAAYRVEFHLDAPPSVNPLGTRPDRIVSGRAGFKTNTQRLLRRVSVKFQTGIIRDYVLTYAHGQFDKTVLSRVTVYGIGGCNASGNAFVAPSCGGAALFHEHSFDYYREDESFSPAKTWMSTGPNANVATLTHGKSTTYSGGVSLGVAEGVEVGVTLARTERNELVGLYDVNGDHLPDQLFHDGTVLYNQSRPNPPVLTTVLFSPAGPSLVNGFPAMPRDIQWSGGVSATAAFELDSHFGGSISAGFDTSVSRATRLLADVNGDSFLDVVDVASQTATLGSRCGDGSQMCYSAAPIVDFDPFDDPVLEQVASDVAARTFVVDPVLQWTAPFDGEVEVSGTATKAGAGGLDGVTVKLYHQDDLLDAISIAATDTAAQAFPAATRTVQVVAGEALYLRVKTNSDEAIGPNAALDDLVDAHVVVNYTTVCRFIACVPVSETDLPNDPAGAPVFSFDSKADLRVANRPAPFVAPVKGQLELHGVLSKRPSGADLRACVQRFPSILTPGFDRDFDQPCDASAATNLSGTIVLPAGSATPVPLDLSIAVDAGEVIVVRIEADLSFDPGDVTLDPPTNGDPLLLYSEVCPLDDAGAAACTTDSEVINEVVVSTEAFGASVFLGDVASWFAWVAPTTGQVTLRKPTAPDEPYLYAIRSDRAGIIYLQDCRNASCTMTDQIFNVRAGDSITVDLHTESGNGSSEVGANYDGGNGYTVPVRVRPLVLAEPAATPFAGGYRGWRAGIWNENMAFAPTPLLEDYADLASQTLERQGQIRRTAIMPQPVFTSPFAGGPAWAAPHSAAFAASTGLSAARLGLVGSSTSDADRGGLFAGRFARQSATRGLYLGAQAKLKVLELGTSISAQATWSTTQTTTDIVDLDGDGVLDIVAGRNTYLSMLAGAALPVLSAVLDLRGGFRKRSARDYSIGFGANAIRRQTTPGGRTIEANAKVAPEGLFGGVGYAVSRGQSEEDLVDVSGDGLPDRVSRVGNDIWVELNLGTRFGTRELFGQVDPGMLGAIDGFESGFERSLIPELVQLDSTSNALQHDTTITRNSHAGFNASIPLLGSVSFGRSTVSTSTRTTRQLADLNGDGLPDLLVKRHDQADVNGDGIIYVQYNLGAGFGPMHEWTARTWPSGALPAPGTFDLDTKLLELGLTGPDVLALTSGSNTGYNGSVSVLGNGASGGRTKGRDRYEMGLVDIDGDGAPEHVLRREGAGANHQILIKGNKVTGRANLLHVVHRPLRGLVTLDYTRTGNTVDMPQSKHVLSSVVVDDGNNMAAPFASPSVSTTFGYADGVHHRGEKEFFGFAKVTTTRADGVTIEDHYENAANKYELRGRLLRQTRTDGSGRLFEEKRITYQVRAVTDASGLPVVIDPACTTDLHPLLGVEACVPRFAVVEREETVRAEGGTLAKTHRVRDLDWDRFGNVLESIDEGDDAIASDELHVAASYRNDTPTWILGRSTALQVRAGGAGGTLLRSRTGEYDASGALVAVHVSTGSGTATTRMTYDAFGNLETLTTPENHAGDPQVYTVGYDATTATYPTSMSDAFGYTSNATYDLRFGFALSETDANGAQMTRGPDAFGRLVAIRGPYDVGPAPALAIEYRHDLIPPRAVTVTTPSAPAEFSGTLPAPTTAVTFVDGFGRTIEQRTTAVVGGVAGTTTSGLLGRDALGRVIRTQHPYFTAGASTAFVDVPELTPATTTEFDVLDRPILTRYPDGAIERSVFDIQTAPDGALLFLRQSIDANGHAREAFVDHAGRTRAFREHPAPGQSSVTTYGYRATGELVQIVDAESNVTTLGYDLRGVRTSLNNPDTGLVEDRYDLMGNRVALIEPNHRALGDEVTFEYERSRLKRIVYPSKPEVTYSYGPAAPAGAPDFRAGRLVRVDDETGSQEHFYGALGEIRKTIRTVLPAEQGNKPFVFDMSFTSDSLGRQLRVVYPDGEVVTNGYDAAGMLSEVRGAGAGWTRTYVSQLHYDVFGNRIHARFGNGVESTWSFATDRVRLHTIATTLPSSATKIQDLLYDYDDGGNPVTITNRLADLTGGSGTLPGKSTVTFTYDDIDRLTSAHGTAQLSHQKSTTYDQRFDYSASHNLLHKQRAHTITQQSTSESAPSATNFASDYVYTPARPHLPTVIGSLQLTYDPSGNPTSRRKLDTGALQNLVWDDDNRLVSFFGGNANQRNTYDADGNRVRRKSTQSETVFASPYFDLENGVQGVSHVFAGSMRVASKLGKFSSSTSPVVAPTKAGTAFFFHADHLGSTSVLTDETGAVQESIEYFPDGEMWIDRGPLRPVSGILFSGKPFDPDTGFYDFGQRFYEPRTSLWLGVDPAVVEGDAGLVVAGPTALAIGGFVAHNPLRYVDPDGRQPREVPNVFNPNHSSPSAYRAWANRPGQQWTDANPIISKAAPVVIVVGGQILSHVLPPLVWDFFAAGLEEGSPTKQPASADPSASADAVANGRLGTLPGAPRLSGRGGSGGTGQSTAARSAGQAGGQGFRSFSAFKRALGPAGPGQQWHHVVEKTPGNVARFGGEAIHNTGNLVRLETGVHRQVSGYYSSIQDFTGGQTVRQWLGTQSLEAQQQFGLDVLRRFGGVP